MAFVVSRGDGRYEVRESQATDRGPRARTLASFRLLTETVLERAERLARTPFDRDAVRRRAMELGAPIPDANATARALLGELRAGGNVAPALARALNHALAEPASRPIPDTAPGALEWVTEDPAAHGRAILDLLDLASHLPQRRRPDTSEFPGIRTQRPRA